jgi:hypothetical protein
MQYDMPHSDTSQSLSRLRRRFRLFFQLQPFCFLPLLHLDHLDVQGVGQDRCHAGEQVEFCMQRTTRQFPVSLLAMLWCERGGTHVDQIRACLKR